MYCNKENFVNFKQKYLEQKSQLLYIRISSDLLTPVSAMIRLHTKSNKYICLLESIENGRHKGRYSAIATHPLFILKVNSDKVTMAKLNQDGKLSKFDTQKLKPMEALQSMIDKVKLDIPEKLPAISCGLFGYIGYETIQWIEKIKTQKNDTLKIPDMLFFIAGVTIVFDTLYDELIISAPVYPSKELTPEKAYDDAYQTIEKHHKILTKPMKKTIKQKYKQPQHSTDTTNVSKQQYCNMVEKAKEYIRAGDIFQVNISQRFELDFEPHPFNYYRSLRRLNPSPYLFYFRLENFSLAGSSPEILVTLKNKKLSIRPLAGTIKRGENQAQDEILAKQLLESPKDRAEHLMLLDLGRNDAGRVAKLGSVKVTKQFMIEKYSHVMHIVSNVEAIIRDDKTALDALKSAFPAGTLSGAPKVRAMQIISIIENTRRGPYSGAAGYFSANGDMDTCIILRTALIKNNKLYIQAGAGIVLDSQAELEYQECINKAKALKLAAGRAYHINDYES